MEEKKTTEKEVILEIQKSLKDAGKLDQEQNMIVKRGILNAIGFENKEPKVEDEEFVKNTLKVVSDELLNGSHIDLDLLQKVVQLQNGINTIDLSPIMKKVVHNDGVLNNMPSINQNENIAKLKYHMEEGNIDPNQEWIEILKERNPQFFNIEHDENYLFHIQKQVPLNNLPAMSVSENPSIEVEPKKAPQLSIDLEEEARMKYLQILENKGWVERKFNQEDDTNNWYSKYDFLQNFYDKTAKYWKSGRYFAEATSLVSLDENGGSKEKIFNLNRFSKGINYPSIENLSDETFHISALKVRADGIKNPFVFVANPRSKAEFAQAERFVEKQINALVEHGGYDIDEINVCPSMKGVLQRIKDEKRELGVTDLDYLRENAIKGKLNTTEKHAFTSFLVDYDSYSTPEEMSLKGKIESNQPLEDYDIEFLDQKLKESRDLKVDYEKPSENISTNDMKKEEELNSALAGMPEADEQHILDNNGKILKDFKDFGDQKGSPENEEQFGFRNPDAQAIMKLNNKIDKGIEIEGLSNELKEIVQKKAILLDLYKNSNYPDMVLGQVTMLLNNKNPLQKAFEEMEIPAQEEVRMIAQSQEQLWKLLDNAGCDIGEFAQQNPPYPEAQNQQKEITQEDIDKENQDLHANQISGSDFEAYEESQQINQEEYEQMMSQSQETFEQPNGGQQGDPVIKKENKKRKRGRTSKVSPK